MFVYWLSNLGMGGGGTPVVAGTIHFFIDPQGATLVDFDSGQSPFGPIDPRKAYEATNPFEPTKVTVVK